MKPAANNQEDANIALRNACHLFFSNLLVRIFLNIDISI